MKRRISVLLAALLAAPAVLAHPHVFIDAGIQVAVEHGSLASVNIRWKWDEVYSDTWITDYDRNNDGKFSAAETKAFIEGATAGLDNFGQFIFVHDAGGKRHPIGKVDNFRLSQEGKSVVYEFRALLARPAPLSAGPFRIGAYDESYFIDVAYPDPTLSGTSETGCTAAIVEDDRHLIYNGLVKPLVLELTCGKP